MNYKGIIKFISKEQGHKFAIVKRYADISTGDVLVSVNSTIAPSAGEALNLSSNNYNVNFTIDYQGPVEIDLRGATPATTTLTEIVAKINAVFPGVASVQGTGTAARIRVTSKKVIIAAGTTNSGLAAIFNATTLSATGTDAFDPKGVTVPVVADFSSKAVGNNIVFTYKTGLNNRTGKEISIIG